MDVKTKSHLPRATQLRQATPESDAIAWAADCLKRGELVALPTETVYGLAARADDANAMLEIFEAKERPTFDPLIGHVPSSWSLKDLIRRGWVDAARLEPLRQSTEHLIAAFWPGPLTLLFPAGPQIEKCHRIMTSGSDWVALRMPAHAVMQAVLRATDLILAAPSANRFGRISPTDAQAVMAELNGRITGVLDGGPCAHGVESTIVGSTEGQEGSRKYRVFRQGALPAASIAKVLAPIELVDAVATSAQGPRVTTPGSLASHYAPQTPVVLHDFDPHRAAGHGETWIFTARKAAAGRTARSLSCSEDAGTASQEAANALFRTMRELDAGGYTCIHIELPPEHWQHDRTTLWPALVDRLRRAAIRP